MLSFFLSVRYSTLDSGAHERYGISLLHKHFSMEANQRLVDFRNISAPWTVNENDDFVVPKYEGFIIPRTFRFFHGNLTPFEFDFSFFSPSRRDTDRQFLQKLSALLHQHGLENILGVRSLDRYDPDLSVEITEGKANIMIPRGSFKESELIEAFWVFGPYNLQKCHCREYCWKSSEGKHLEDHGCS
ncbi:hypothetical protein BDV06DRAFT_217856 [Aspergillus oleicola]